MDGERAPSGSAIGPKTGVEGALGDELLENDEERLLDEVAEVKDDERELDERDREGEVASEVAGLTPRWDRLAVFGVRRGRQATFLRARGAFGRRDTNVAGSQCGLGDRNGCGRDCGAEMEGKGGDKGIS